MCNASQGTSGTVASFTMVKSLWDELDDLDQIHAFAYNLARKMLKRE